MVDIICTTIWSDKLFFSQKLIVTSFVGITHFIVPHWLIGSEGKVNWSVNSMSLLPRSISLCQICQMLFHQLHLYEVQKKDYDDTFYTKEKEQAIQHKQKEVISYCRDLALIQSVITIYFIESFLLWLWIL